MGEREPSTRVVELTILILAAGRSTRFGGGNKLSADLDGLPVLAHTIRAAKAATAARILVVTGHDREVTGRIASSEGAEIAHNEGYDAGMGSSIAAGVRATPRPVAPTAPRATHARLGAVVRRATPRRGAARRAEAAQAWLVWPGDMPFVRPETARAVLDAWVFDRPVVPTCGGARGHPVLFPLAFRDGLLRLEADQGARALLANALEVETGDPGILTDVDTPEDLPARNP